MADTTPARMLLASTKLGELLHPQHVTTIKENASVDQALRVSNAFNGSFKQLEYCSWIGFCRVRCQSLIMWPPAFIL